MKVFYRSSYFAEGAIPIILPYRGGFRCVLALGLNTLQGSFINKQENIFVYLLYNIVKIWGILSCKPFSFPLNLILTIVHKYIRN